MSILKSKKKFFTVKKFFTTKQFINQIVMLGKKLLLKNKTLAEVCVMPKNYNFFSTLYIYFLLFKLIYYVSIT